VEARGYIPNPHLSGEDTGPGFIGRLENDMNEELIFSLEHIVPGSKAKYFFPDSEDPQTGYRGMAGRNAWDHVERG